MADKLVQRVEDERKRKAKDNSKEKDYMDHELNKKTTTYTSGPPPDVVKMNPSHLHLRSQN